MPQLVVPIFSPECKQINNQVGFEEIEGRIYYFHGLLPVCNTGGKFSLLSVLREIIPQLLQDVPKQPYVMFLIAQKQCFLVQTCVLSMICIKSNSTVRRF